MSEIFSIFSAGASVAAGRSQQQAFAAEANLKREQGNIAAAEALTASLDKEKENKALRKKTALTFIKGGVTLAGSPLFLISAQKEEDTIQELSIKKRGLAQQNLAFAQADILENRGRTAFLSGIATAGATLTEGFA